MLKEKYTHKNKGTAQQTWDEITEMLQFTFRLNSTCKSKGTHFVLTVLFAIFALHLHPLPQQFPLHPAVHEQLGSSAPWLGLANARHSERSESKGRRYQRLPISPTTPARPPPCNVFSSFCQSQNSSTSSHQASVTLFPPLLLTWGGGTSFPVMLVLGGSSSFVSLLNPPWTSVNNSLIICSSVEPDFLNTAFL